MMEHSMQFLPVLVVGFTAALGLTPVSRQIAMRLGVVDKPNYRKIHYDHKPLMGGLAIFLAFALALLLFSPTQYLTELGAVVAGAAVLALTGLVDDRFDISPLFRFCVMIGTACLLIAVGIHVNWFNNPLLDYPLTVFWVVAIINAMNFLDNMDGLCAGIAAISSGFFLLIALAQGLTLVSLLAAALLGSAVGFLSHNFNPASTFMGDMGALVLGFVMATLAIKVDFWAEPFNPYSIVPLLAMALPVFDVNLTVFTRLAEHRPIAKASKEHISHRLMSVGFTQRQTLAILYSAAILCGILALALMAVPLSIAWGIVLFCAVVTVAMYGMMIYIRKTYQKV
jgi:UDP-GlcNAc:undecaprenyl-phosphate/decaprenyl-phosphate GlcNAc-1-phosphate transferase